MHKNSAVRRIAPKNTQTVSFISTTQAPLLPGDWLQSLRPGRQTIP